jgi:hypothetical protein
MPDPERARRRRRLAWVALVLLGGPSLVVTLLRLFLHHG